MMSATAEATVAAAQWEGHADRRKPEYLLMSTIRSTELPGLGAKLILSWNKQPLGVSPLWEVVAYLQLKRRAILFFTNRTQDEE